MKAMSDNEFDKAFKSSFEDLEVEPTAKSWENISAQLDEKPKGKKLSIFWLSAAASVVIVLGIGISIYQKPTEDIIKLRAQEKPKDVVIENGIDSQAANKKDSKISDNEVVLNDINKNEVLVNSPVKADKNQVEITKNSTLEKNISIDATINPKENVLVVKNVEEVIAATKPVRKPTVTEKMIAAEEAKKVSINNQTALAINNTDYIPSDEGAQSDRKLKIKSVGDLVNFVVAKVDKRDEKIIKIGKTDESDTEITGINLGLFKFRKAEK